MAICLGIRNVTALGRYSFHRTHFLFRQVTTSSITVFYNCISTFTHVKITAVCELTESVPLVEAVSPRQIIDVDERSEEVEQRPGEDHVVIDAY